MKENVNLCRFKGEQLNVACYEKHILVTDINFLGFADTSQMIETKYVNTLTLK